MSRRRVWFRRVLVVGLVILAAEQTWRHGREYVIAEEFAEVEPGKLYRGAWQRNWPMRRIIRDHDIKTIVALAHPPGDPLSRQEKALAKEMGCRWVHIPIVDNRSDADQNDLASRLERAAAELAKSENQPVYFHCHHGINRASMVQMAYRMIYCDWTLKQATDEIARTFGLKRVDHGPDYRYMEVFYKNRILPRRAAEATAKAQSKARTAAAEAESSTRR